MLRRHSLISAVALSFAGLALAASSPLQFVARLDPTGILELQTGAMPKGWFNLKNTFVGTKTDVRTTVMPGATECSPAKPTLSLSSLAEGSFTAILNANDSNAVGYTYELVRDISAAANHWYTHTHCDGRTEVHGCAAAVPVTVTSTAYDTVTGACRTFTSDAGVTTCAGGTSVVLLTAIQDPDVVDTSCSDSCGIGACVSTCEDTCNTQFSGRGAADARRACKSQCVCTCKLTLPVGCGSHDECRD